MQKEIIDWQDLASRDYYLFGPMKEGWRDVHHGSDKEVKTAVMKRLKEQSREFYETGIHAHIGRWDIAIEKTSNYVEK